MKGKSYFKTSGERGILVKPNIITSQRKPRESLIHRASHFDPKARAAAFKGVLTEHNVRKHTKRSGQEDMDHLAVGMHLNRDNSPALSSNTEVASLTSSNLRKFEQIHPAKPIDPSKLPTIEQCMEAKGASTESDKNTPPHKMFDIRSTSPSLKNPSPRTEKSNSCLSELFINMVTPAGGADTKSTSLLPGTTNIQPNSSITLRQLLETGISIPEEPHEPKTLPRGQISPSTAAPTPRTSESDEDNKSPEQHLAGQLMKLNIRRRAEWDHPIEQVSEDAASCNSGNKMAD